MKNYIFFLSLVSMVVSLQCMDYRTSEHVNNFNETYDALLKAEAFDKLLQGLKIGNRVENYNTLVDQLFDKTRNYFKLGHIIGNNIKDIDTSWKSIQKTITINCEERKELKKAWHTVQELGQQILNSFLAKSENDTRIMQMTIKITQVKEFIAKLDFIHSKLDCDTEKRGSGQGFLGSVKDLLGF